MDSYLQQITWFLFSQVSHWTFAGIGDVDYEVMSH